MLRYDGLYRFSPPAYDELDRGQTYLRFYEDGTILMSGNSGTPEQAAPHICKDDAVCNKGRYTIVDGVLTFYAFVELPLNWETLPGSPRRDEAPSLLVAVGEGSVDKDVLKLNCRGSLHSGGEIFVRMGGYQEYFFVEVVLH